MTPLREQLAAIPDVEILLSADIERAIAESVHYLDSDEAQASLIRDIYWPKWDSPWWHMLVLFEMGQAHWIPERAVRAMVAGLDAIPSKHFSIRPEDLPPGVDINKEACHCSLGSIYRVLAACGVDPDRAIPWAEPWFVRYQMEDGGLNCDSAAYLAEGECPSSMVGTIPPIEAMLTGDSATWSDAHLAFLDRAAGFLVERQLRLGSQTKMNAEERDRAPQWLHLCFPRLYLYDVLRGLHALVKIAEIRGAAIPLAAIQTVTTHLVTSFPDGIAHATRRAYDGIGTRMPEADGRFTRQAATLFPLLQHTSTLGSPSPWLTQQWTDTRRALLRLFDAGQIRS